MSPDVVPSQVHENYEQVAGTLLHMVTTGEFPFENIPTGVRHGTPRLTDGFVQIDEDGVVVYTNPMRCRTSTVWVFRAHFAGRFLLSW